jgi:hypothetical protein
LGNKEAATDVTGTRFDRAGDAESGTVIASLHGNAGNVRDREELAVLRYPVAARYSLVSLLILVAGGLRAAPPEQANPELHGWFESLKQPGSGISCCSIADCLPVDYKMETEGYEALIEARWVRIPGDKVLHGKPNPTGRAILCRSPISGTILCFVPAGET